VTRLGEFSPIGSLFTLVIFLITKIVRIFGHFFYGYGYAVTLTKICWATFWAIFHKPIWSPCPHGSLLPKDECHARMATYVIFKVNVPLELCRKYFKPFFKPLM
jgi:hypothetical protein